MEEIVSLILHGCKSARDLESNLPNSANQLNTISQSCDEIIRFFTSATQRLNIFRESQPSMNASVQESYESNYTTTHTQAMDVIQTVHFLAQNSRGLPESWTAEGIQVSGMGGISEVNFQRPGSSPQRPRTRRDEVKRWSVRVPAPRIGNTEVPPEDGYTWRKYGQKKILGFRFPRGYYRCTHQKSYQCPAKKQVQRLNDNPLLFEVMYRCDHTCHMSSTAPSIPPPPSITTQHIIQTMPSLPLGRWLSMELSLGDSTDAGPSNVPYGTDMADAMLNSGSTTTNSMDLIFSSSEIDKWEPQDKNN